MGWRRSEGGIAFREVCGERFVWCFFGGLGGEPFIVHDVGEGGCGPEAGDGDDGGGGGEWSP